MAEAALSFAVEKLGNLAIQKVDFLLDVEDQVKWLKGELKTMQCFLKDAAEKQANDERIRKWISDIRELAHDAEDAIETFVLQVDNPRRSRGLLGRCACFPNHLYHLDRLGQEIESIRATLKDIDERRARYGIQNLGEVPRRSEDVERRRLSPMQKDKNVVGLDEDVKLLLQRSLLEEGGGLSIASIVGMGGIGKSTLARVVYNNASVADRFDLRAWVVVSREFDPKEVIKELMLQLLEPKEDKLKILEIMEKLQLPSLRDMLHERLKGRRFFIVVDDVWREEDWESLASAFPDEQDKASRLLFTSRNRDIPSCARYVHQQEILDEEKSWELFLKKAFIDNIDGKCPEELEDIGREISRKCAGLPLAITVVGGLLVKQRQSKSGWEKVLKGMNSHLGRSESSVSAILELSYQDLPPHLKSCFLCLGFFKEDATIQAKKLVHIWIAEGLVPQEEEGEETTEEIARGYLDELINRNMVQVQNTSMDDKVKHYKIHDLLRELSIRKAKEEISFEILSDVHHGDNITQPRHLAIYCSSTERFSAISSNKRLRSLFIHGVSNIDDISSSNWKISGLLLRVLDMEGLGLKILPDTIGTLHGLRYLGLRNNKLRKLPTTLGRLKNLQVLDIALNRDVQLPNVIWKMDSLCHLYMSSIMCEEPFNISALKNLQTLIHIHIKMDNWILDDQHLTQMTALRKLGIILDENLDVSKICTSLAMLKNLDCLYLRSAAGLMLSLNGLVILQHLTQLKLKHMILRRLPSTSDFPPNLSYLTLSLMNFKEDPIPVLEKLPKLLYLKFDVCSFDGEEMVISHFGFPMLKVLLLQKLFDLKNLEVRRGGMPELRRLEIDECPHLQRLPKELKFMTNLEELKMVTSIEVASKLKGIDSHIISNIPSVHLSVAEKPFRIFTEEEFVEMMSKWIEDDKELRSKSTNINSGCHCCC